jgi:hypothetical protein
MPNMDYTTTAIVKSDAHIAEATDDTLLARKVVDASRAIDRLVTGRVDVSNYFLLETIALETLTGTRNPLVDSDNHLILWPHKPVITAVTAVNYRYTPMESYQAVDPTTIQISNGMAVECWGTFARARIMAQVSYSGGLAAAVANLPNDLVELATLLTIRMYKESQSGMSDVVGLNDFGVAQYVKALPVRFQDFIGRYARVIPW